MRKRTEVRFRIFQVLPLVVQELKRWPQIQAEGHSIPPNSPHCTCFAL